MNYQRRSVLHGLAVLPIGSLSSRVDLNGRNLVARDGRELAAALRLARPGAVIGLAAGEFGGVAQFEIGVPEVTLRSLTPSAAVLRAPVVVTAGGVTLADLAFHGEGDDGFYLSAIASCSDSLSIAAPDVEVKGCDFGYFPKRAILVRPTGLRPYIHDCTFHDNRDGDGDHNAHEAISLGYDNPTSNVAMRARVIANRLWNLNIEDEAICAKTSDNLIQGNQISSSKGAYSNRYGERNQFINNKSINSRGFLVEDRSNRLVGNRIEGSGKTLILGGGVSASVTTNGPHVQATSTYLEGNTGLLVIGHNYSGTNLPALNTQVKTHSGSIQLKNHTGTRLPGQV